MSMQFKTGFIITNPCEAKIQFSLLIHSSNLSL